MLLLTIFSSNKSHCPTWSSSFLVVVCTSRLVAMWNQFQWIQYPCKRPPRLGATARGEREKPGRALRRGLKGGDVTSHQSSSPSPPTLPTPSASAWSPSKAAFLRPRTADAIVTGPRQCPGLTQSLFMNSPYTVWQSVAEKCPHLPPPTLFSTLCLLLVDLFSRRHPSPSRPRRL